MGGIRHPLRPARTAGGGDDVFTRDLLDTYQALGRFGHREHLHMTWATVRRKGMPGATEDVIRFIERVASDHGGGSLYNETMTRFFVDAMARAVACSPDDADFEQVLARNPHLTDKHLAERHWSRELLASREAASGWVEPDLEPLPEAPVLPPRSSAFASRG